MAQWLALPNLNSRQRAQLVAEGVTWEATHRAGGLAWGRVQIVGRCFDFSDSGDLAIIQGVWDGPAPSIYAVNDRPPADLIAWTLDAPEEWFYRHRRHNLVLGADILIDAHCGGPPPRLLTTPLEWLQAGCQGIVLLDWCESIWRAGEAAEAAEATAAWWGGAAA